MVAAVSLEVGQGDLLVVWTDLYGRQKSSIWTAVVAMQVVPPAIEVVPMDSMVA